VHALVVFWIVILLCIIAQWAATWAREMAQRGLEALQPLFLQKREPDLASIQRARLPLSSRFDEVRLL